LTPRPLRELFDSLRFIIRPSKVLAETREELPLLLSVPLLYLLRYLHLYLHALLVHGGFYLSKYSSLSSFFLHEFNPYQGWLNVLALLSLPSLLYLLGRVMGREVDYLAAEHGFFHLLVASIFLVPSDLVHLLLPSTYFLGYCMHLSLLLHLLLLPVWMSLWAERFLGIKKRYSLAPSFFFAFSLKYLPQWVFSPPLTILSGWVALLAFLQQGRRSRLLLLLLCGFSLLLLG
jgi:hypothetical protein